MRAPISRTLPSARNLSPSLTSPSILASYRLIATPGFLTSSAVSAVEGEAAVHVEVAADLGFDEIDAAEHGRSRSGRRFRRPARRGHRLRAEQQFVMIELLQLGVADVDSVIEQAIDRT